MKQKTTSKEELRKKEIRPRILVVDPDDEKLYRDMLQKTLMKEGYEITTFDPAVDDKVILEKQYDVAIVDLVMPGTSGFKIREEIAKHSPHTQFIIITAYADKEKLDEAMEAGVYTFLSKPFRGDHIKYAVLGALRIKEMHQQRLAIQGDIDTRTMEYIGDSSLSLILKRKIMEIAASTLPVLITGESGTGKEVTARSLHQFSKRAGKIFLAMNCASISSNLIESEMFGHVQGAFTGAGKTKHGYFEAADGGTLFLDEIGELPLNMQSKFLRVLDAGEFSRVGETKTRKVNVRIVSATNGNVEKMVEDGLFRKDLYYRLKGGRIRIPALRERQEDIPLLVYFFLSSNKIVVLPEAMLILQQYKWPGNVRELKMVIESLIGTCTNNVITKNMVSGMLDIDGDKVPDDTLTYENFKNNVIRNEEYNYFKSLLEKSNGNISQAARLAGIQRKNLYIKLKNYNLIP